MIKRFIALFSILIALTANAGTGDWVLYPSYHNATYCQKAGDRIYVLASGALFSYNTSDDEVRTYDKINTLSDIDITHIAYCKDMKALVIVYSNANIDILYEDDEVYNISDFKNKSLPSKKINGINIQGTTAYLSTSFGIVELDLEEYEFTNTYNTGLNTYCTYLFKDKLFCGTETGMFCCDINKNLLDKNNWVKKNNHYTKSICELDGMLYCHLYEYGIYSYNADTNILKDLIYNHGEKYNAVYSTGKEIIASAKKKTTVITGPQNIVTYKNTGSNFILRDGNSFWDCKGYRGIVKCDIKDNNIVEVATPVVPNCPIRNYCEFMQFTNDDKLLVAGGNLNFFDITFYDGTLMEYDYLDDKWTNLPEDTIKQVTGIPYLNLCSIDEDPTEPGHYFAGSFGYGLYEFRDGKFVKHYNLDNSPLESVLPTSYEAYRFVRITSVKFDNEGNLWCINTGVKNIIKILKKDGTWTELYYKAVDKLPTIVDPFIDSRGWLWLTSLQDETGVFCAKMNGTPFDTSDDESKIWLNKFTNQDGISYDVYQVYAVVEDMNGEIWVGTNTGLFVIDNPKTFFDKGIFKQIKVPRNDGTGLADYLLSGTYIKAMKVDGANRKWVGTNDNGVYLISADGKETIHHFTTENSPLPSNNIVSIAINGKSGDVFIGTDKGMASYMSDATRPQETLDEKNIYAYPNPVRANYSGNISIVGLTHGCNVKIVDAAGFLINEGTSNGGQYNWNGRNQQGEKVPSGVYYVLTYDSNGDEGVATKILVTR